MTRRKGFTILGLLVCVGLAKLALADIFDDAERSTSTFVNNFSELKRLSRSELELLVRAICDAEEEDRRSVSRDAAYTLKSKVSSEYDKLQRQKDEALTNIAKVLSDEKFRDKHSRTKEYEGKVKETWSSIERMTSSVRGANHPVVAYMLETGQEEHRRYQSNSSNCTVAEHTLPSGRADCIYASSCEVIELKPNNYRARSKGREQAERYARSLNEDPREREKLIEKSSNFRSCQKFSWRVMCYTLCPEFDDEGQFRSVSVRWDSCN